MNWIHMGIKYLNKKHHGFTLIELLVGIAIVGILVTIALPSLSRFVVGMRVENEMSELHRLLLITRNTAISSGNRTTICPLVSNACVNDWTKEISVFEDINGNGEFNPPPAGSTIGDALIKVKSPIKSSDTLQFTGGISVTYAPTGQLTGGAANTFSYCPNGYSDESKGIIMSILGRPYISRDSDGDGFDEDRNNVQITCV